MLCWRFQALYKIREPFTIYHLQGNRCPVLCTRLYYVHALATTDGYTTVAILQHARVSASIGLYAELVGVATLQSLPSLNSDFHMRMNNEWRWQQTCRTQSKWSMIYRMLHKTLHTSIAYTRSLYICKDIPTIKVYIYSLFNIDDS